MSSRTFRVVLAFIVSPLLVPAIIVLLSDVQNSYDLMLLYALGSMALGYGFAIFLGVPWYLIFFRKVDVPDTFDVAVFIILCTLLFAVFWGSIVCSGNVLALLSPTFIGLSAIFGFGVTITVLLFCAIAFRKQGEN